MKQLGRLVWWLGPWLGMAFFAWRQQGLESELAAWVGATNKTIQARITELTNAAGFVDTSAP